MNKILGIIILTIGIIVAVLLIMQGYKPEFFDIFGVFTHIFLLIVGSWILLSKEKLPNWIGFIILLIGILGLIVDGFIVIKTYFIGG